MYSCCPILPFLFIVASCSKAKQANIENNCSFISSVWILLKTGIGICNLRDKSSNFCPHSWRARRQMHSSVSLQDTSSRYYLALWGFGVKEACRFWELHSGQRINTASQISSRLSQYATHRGLMIPMCSWSATLLDTLSLRLHDAGQQVCNTLAGR